VVVRYDDPRLSLTSDAVKAAIIGGKAAIPCEVTALQLGTAQLTLPTTKPCVAAEQIAAGVLSKSIPMALLPPGLVVPSVKVLEIGTADLFGGPKERTVAYPLTATGAVPAEWAAYDPTNVRTLISTGDTCPDAGFPHMAVTLGHGWSWVLNGGTVHYRGTVMNTLYSGPAGNGWPVPIIARNGDSGKVSALISDNDVSANDFECPMVSNWKINTTGVKVFTIDPRVAKLLATQGGLKVVTLGSNHITDAGREGVRATIAYLDAAGIKHTGAGANLAAALAPAVVDVRGIKFAFVGWDDISGSRVATDTLPGAAPMTDANVCASIKAARQVADIVIAMPQWGEPEYHAYMTKKQVAQRAFFYSCGADDILGSGTHWASWASIMPGPNGPQFAIGSHGNFLFPQNWSRQTMEGVVVEATFYGKTLVQFRLHPYVVFQNAQPNLLNPTTDGKYVLNQVWSSGTVK
jgi:poly-gamma-glutamate synthesis protein (capsule biosynthesis protein)